MAHRVKEAGVWYVPTITGYKQNAEPSWGRGEFWHERYEILYETHFESVQKAINAGVFIATGTDTLGTVAEEVGILRKAGLTPQQAIDTATINGAVVCEMDEQIGSLEVGKLADILVIDGDPLDDTQALQNVKSVYIGGKLYEKGFMDGLVPLSDMWAEGW